MAEPDIPSRVRDLQSCMDYGFSRCKLYTDSNGDVLEALPVTRGTAAEVSIKYDTPFQYLDTEGRDLSTVEKTLSLPESIEAPVNENDILGEAVYTLNGTVLGSVSIRAAADVEQADFRFFFVKAAHSFFI